VHENGNITLSKGSETQKISRKHLEPTAPSVGARVKLHSLQQKPEHNGVEGEVLEFDASAGRWKVQLHPDRLVLVLKASNLAVLAPQSSCAAQTSKSTRPSKSPSSMASAARWWSPREIDSERERESARARTVT
jgi:hypothetical protein